MKKSIFIIFLLFLLPFFGQSKEGREIPIKYNILTIGFLQGGGSLIGLDIERLVTKKLGIAVGVGFLGFGGAIHYHLKPRANSPSIAMVYLHQGINDTYVQSVIGPAFVYKANKLFSVQLGIGGIIEEGPNFNRVYKGSNSGIILTYSVGLFF